MENDAVSLHWPLCQACVMKPSASFLIFYDPSDTFLRRTCENTYDKASPRGACSPFIQQIVVKTDVLG